MDIILLMIVAVFIIIKLFSVIGQDVGGNTDAFKETAEAIKNPQKPKVEKTLAEPEAPVIALDKDTQNIVQKIKKADSDFIAEEFIAGAQGCFEQVLDAFTNDNKDALKNYMKPATWKAFCAFIDERVERKEDAKDEIVGFVRTEFLDMANKTTSLDITVKFTTDQINVVYDNEGRVVCGHPSDIVRLEDTWVFTKNTKDADSNWFVKETL